MERKRKRERERKKRSEIFFSHLPNGLNHRRWIPFYGHALQPPKPRHQKGTDRLDDSRKRRRNRRRRNRRRRRRRRRRRKRERNKNTTFDKWSVSILRRSSVRSDRSTKSVRAGTDSKKNIFKKKIRSSNSATRRKKTKQKLGKTRQVSPNEQTPEPIPFGVNQRLDQSAFTTKKRKRPTKKKLGNGV